MRHTRVAHLTNRGKHGGKDGEESDAVVETKYSAYIVSPLRKHACADGSSGYLLYFLSTSGRRAASARTDVDLTLATARATLALLRRLASSCLFSCATCDRYV